MPDPRTYYVEWRTYGSKIVQQRIFRDTTYEKLINYMATASDIVYLYFEDITNQSITDFEEKVGEKRL